MLFKVEVEALSNIFCLQISIKKLSIKYFEVHKTFFPLMKNVKECTRVLIIVIVGGMDTFVTRKFVKNYHKADLHPAPSLPVSLKQDQSER